MNFWKRLWMFLALAILWNLANYLIRQNLRHQMPPAEMLPVLLAPGLTFATAVLTFWEYARRHRKSNEKILVLNAISILIVIFVCIMLVLPIDPLMHVLVVLAIFSYFLVWDRVMIKLLSAEKGAEVDIGEIVITSRLINIPTVFALIILFAFMLWHAETRNHFLSDEARHLFNWDGAPGVINNAAEVASVEAELFVSGLVAFHLCVTAIAYLVSAGIDEVIRRAGASDPAAGGSASQEADRSLAESRTAAVVQVHSA